MKRPLPPLRVLTLLALAVGALFAPIPSSVFAQSDDAANGLEISPVLVELNTEPVGSYNVNIKVRNVTKSTLFFSTSVDDFGAKNESGEPNIVLEEDGEPLPTSIKSWVEPIPAFTLVPNEEYEVNATINVPEGAEPGGHYGVIRFSGHTSSDDNGNVGLVASAGTLILARVRGDAKESLDLASFEATKNGRAGLIFESGPITFVSRFTNSGSVHLKPIGQIEIKDSFGGIVASLPVNDAKGNVLPSSTRRFETTLDESWMFGRYTADISIAYGTTGQAIVRTINFWVIPWKIVLAVVLFAGTLIYILKMVLQRYNSYIIKKDRAGRKNSKPKRK